MIPVKYSRITFIFYYIIVDHILLVYTFFWRDYLKGNNSACCLKDYYTSLPPFHIKLCSKINKWKFSYFKQMCILKLEYLYASIHLRATFKPLCLFILPFICLSVCNIFEYTHISSTWLCTLWMIIINFGLNFDRSLRQWKHGRSKLYRLTVKIKATNMCAAPYFLSFLRIFMKLVSNVHSEKLSDSRRI